MVEQWGCRSLELSALLAAVQSSASIHSLHFYSPASVSGAKDLAEILEG